MRNANLAKLFGFRFRIDFEWIRIIILLAGKKSEIRDFWWNHKKVFLSKCIYDFKWKYHFMKNIHSFIHCKCRKCFLFSSIDDRAHKIKTVGNHIVECLHLNLSICSWTNRKLFACLASNISYYFWHRFWRCCRSFVSKVIKILPNTEESKISRKTQKISFIFLLLRY